jgi:hypothetical protein
VKKKFNGKNKLQAKKDISFSLLMQMLRLFSCINASSALGRDTPFVIID